MPNVVGFGVRMLRDSFLLVAVLLRTSKEIMEQILTWMCANLPSMQINGLRRPSSSPTHWPIQGLQTFKLQLLQIEPVTGSQCDCEVGVLRPTATLPHLFLVLVMIRI